MFAFLGSSAACSNPAAVCVCSGERLSLSQRERAGVREKMNGNQRLPIFLNRSKNFEVLRPASPISGSIQKCRAPYSGCDSPGYA